VPEIHDENEEVGYGYSTLEGHMAPGPDHEDNAKAPGGLNNAGWKERYVVCAEK